MKKPRKRSRWGVMNNPVGSNIPKAREILRAILTDREIYIPKSARADIGKALKLMTRAPACKHAAPVEVRITPRMRARISALAKARVSHHKIANAVGLPNGGRVSEILNELR